MIGKLIKNKISEQKGLSIVIALFALIVIIAVSTLMINSAFSNIGRVRRNQQAEQNYLTEASAVQLMKECLSEVSISYDYSKTVTDEDGTTTEDECRQGPDYKDKLTDGNLSPFREDLIAWFNANAVRGTEQNLDKYYYLKLSDKSDIDASVKVHDVVIHARINGTAYPDGLGDATAETVTEDDEDSRKSTTTDKRSNTAEMILDFYLKDGDSSGDSSVGATGSTGSASGSIGSDDSTGIATGSTGSDDSTDSAGTTGGLGRGADGSNVTEQNYLMNMTVSFNLSYTKTDTEEIISTSTTGSDGSDIISTTTTNTTSINCNMTNTSAPEVNKGRSKKTS